ncbi:hypothetical protein I6F48_00290 [Pseudoalteromonas sp. SWYJ118]|uniref:hypothetical protein n=1 Tax=Pseudoalteromonas sp. SWYJ118 TaxID=2792062 RepID=UPI0018CCB663|nr:hypothetical protein [Pseudoalteromonas sp. SWYJ118]MBH0074002.1 hypothetical protein [Pseudoalteromonas sp. SWYJ118]
MKNNTKKLLRDLRYDIHKCDGWFWTEDLNGIKALEETLNNGFWIKEPDFNDLALEVLKFLEIIDDCGNIDTHTIQIRANVWSDEEEFNNHDKDSGFNCFEDYLESKANEVFYELEETIVKSLFVFHYTNFRE